MPPAMRAVRATSVIDAVSAPVRGRLILPGVPLPGVEPLPESMAPPGVGPLPGDVPAPVPTPAGELCGGEAVLGGVVAGGVTGVEAGGVEARGVVVVGVGVVDVGVGVGDGPVMLLVTEVVQLTVAPPPFPEPLH
jgi:hypothetical protein